jgi:putative transposase
LIICLVKENVEDKKMARKISIHLCHCFSGEKLQNIGECFGLSESGVAQASRRMSNEAEKDKILGQLFKEIKEKLGLYDV